MIRLPVPARFALTLLLPAALAACGGSGNPLIPQLRPVEGGWVSSGFGPREEHPVLGHVEGRAHDGYDFAVAEGSPIKATMAGEVVFAGLKGGYGKAVVIAHQGGLTTLYGHARELRASPGDRVEAGDVIAFVGSTGISTGPHLHYELRKHGVALDPGEFLPTDVRPEPAPLAPTMAALPALASRGAARPYERTVERVPEPRDLLAWEGEAHLARPAKTGE